MFLHLATYLHEAKSEGNYESEFRCPSTCGAPSFSVPIPGLLGLFTPY